MAAPVPATPEAFAASPLAAAPWYYSVEVFPGLVARGQYPPDLPMLPRLMARHADVAGQTCLDIGSMDGLMPTLLARRGASRVVATDAVPHCEDRLAAVRAYYGVDFEFSAIGLLYDLHAKLAGQGFDFINLSGVLYHVYSPLMVLASIRSLLKRNGLIVVSTNITYTEGFSAEFNAEGRLQPEANTFWYLSIPLFDYMLRMLRLAPIDCLHISHEGLGITPSVPGLQTGYMSVLCQARDDLLPSGADTYLDALSGASWEYGSLTAWPMADGQPVSSIRPTDPYPDLVWRDDLRAIDLWATAQRQGSRGAAERVSDSHQLSLGDRD